MGLAAAAVPGRQPAGMEVDIVPVVGEGMDAGLAEVGRLAASHGPEAMDLFAELVEAKGLGKGAATVDASVKGNGKVGDKGLGKDKDPGKGAGNGKKGKGKFR